MERLVGQSLAEQFKQHGPMHFNELAVYLKQVLSGLEIAHQRGVLHRDLKPDNIFIVRHQPGQKAVAKILDFGIATHLHLQPDDDRLTQSGMVMARTHGARTSTREKSNRSSN